MSKPYSKSDFSYQITFDRNWRLKEISDLRSSILKSDENGQTVLLRAMITICYAHWEGAVKFSARKFMEHIALRKHSYHELDTQFLKNSFIPRVSNMYGRKFNVQEACNLIDDVLNAGSKRYSFFNEDLIDTKANLNFRVFSDICVVCGVNPDKFSRHKAFIDIFLLKRRNEIAHGEETLVDIRDLDKLKDTTLEIVRTFSTELENVLYLDKHKTA